MEQMASKGLLAPRTEEELRPELRGRSSTVSMLSSEESEREEEEKCVYCGSTDFKMRWSGLGGKEKKTLVCGKCGKTAV